MIVSLHRTVELVNASKPGRDTFWYQDGSPREANNNSPGRYTIRPCLRTRRFIAAFKIAQQKSAEFSSNPQALFHIRLELSSLLFPSLTNGLTSGSPPNILSALLVCNMCATSLTQLIFCHVTTLGILRTVNTISSLCYSFSIRLLIKRYKYLYILVKLQK